MTGPEPLTPPSSSPTLKDVAHAITVKAAVSSVPIAGPVLSELLQLVVTSPAQQRLDRFLQAVADRLNALGERGMDLQRLASDEGFQDTVASAIDAGRRTQSEERRKRLLSCIESSARLDVDADRQRFYMQCVDNLTNAHVAVLTRFRNRAFHPATLADLEDGPAMTAMLNTLGWAEADGDHLASILLDLSARGLITNRLRSGTRLGSRNFQKMEITDMGTGLLAFVREPG